MFSISVPTHKYIKNFLEQELGPNPILKDSFYYSFLRLTITRKSNNNKHNYRGRYKEAFVFKIADSHHKRYGNGLNESQIMAFNTFMKRFIRKQFYIAIVTYLSFDKNITRAIEHARQILHVPETDYSDDAVIKDFQRYRKNQENEDQLRIYKRRST